MTLRPGKFLWAGALFFAPLVRAQNAAPPAASTPPAVEGVSARSPTNAVAAVVNGEIITYAQVLKQVDLLNQENPAQGVPGIHDQAEAKYPDDPTSAAKEFEQRVAVLQKETLHNMIEKVLIIQEFNSKGYTIPKYYLDQAYEDSMTTRFQGDHEKYLSYLEANKLSEADYRKQQQDDMIVQSMGQQLRSSATGISPDRIKSYYEKNQQKFYVKGAIKVRQITLTPVADETVEVIRQQAEKIVQQARAPGANFTELALKNSTDQAARNGDVPVSIYDMDDKSKQLAPLIQDAVFKLQPGEVSDPIVSGTSVFIFKCEDKVAEGVQPLEKVREQIEQILTQDDQRQAYEKWIGKLRDKAYILNYLDQS
jgi:peptidyl-prolyl cis-trans isomerase SurA